MIEVEADDGDIFRLIGWGIAVALGVVLLVDYFLSGGAGGHVAQDVGLLLLAFGALLGVYLWTRRGRKR